MTCYDNPLTRNSWKGIWATLVIWPSLLLLFLLLLLLLVVVVVVGKLVVSFLGMRGS